MIYILLADGFEEVEAIATLDVLRRAGLEVQLAGVGKTEIVGAHSLCISADIKAEDIETEDVEGVILPGGMPGTKNLQNDKKVIELVNYCNERELLLCAICAAPMILGELGLLEGKDAVCFPGFEKHLKGANLVDCSVVVCDNIITARGAGVALEFGSAIVDYFSGENGCGDKILSQMQYPSL